MLVAVGVESHLRVELVDGEDSGEGVAASAFVCLDLGFRGAVGLAVIVAAGVTFLAILASEEELGVAGVEAAVGV